jgi:hypothetical protein
MGFRYPCVTPLSDSMSAIARIIPAMVLGFVAAIAGDAVLLAI